MQSDTRLGRLLAVLALGALLGPAPAPAKASEPLGDVRFAVGDSALFGAPGATRRDDERGTWEFQRGRMVDGRLELHFEIAPLLHTLPVKSGPAVLFAGVSLFGSPGGDIGMDMYLPPFSRVAIPACDDDSDCRYTADISIPTDAIPAAIERFERDGDLIDVVVDLTLVRTFGDGQWLQILGFGHGSGGRSDAIAGTLGAMDPAHGELRATGLFPADQARPVPKEAWNLPTPFDYAAVVERLRRETGDRSTPLPTVDAAIDVRFEPACPYEMELILHDDKGNHLYHTYTDDHGPAVGGTTHMPIGRPWYLAMNGGDGIDYTIIRLGPIESAGSPVRISAVMDCVGHMGTLAVVGGVQPSPTSSAPSVMPTVPGTPEPPVSPTPATPASPLPTPLPTGSVASTDQAFIVVATLITLVALIAVAILALRGRAGIGRA